jgi:putative ABC transport system substrate-binding protein
MQRREFIIALGCSAAIVPVMARAQRPAGPPTIGYLGAYSQAVQAPWTDAFVKRLRELGWVDGSTVKIEYRWAEGRADRFAEIAAEFARLKVDVLVTGGTEPVLAAKRATPNIPIVFATAADPIGTGIVASLAKPGGNITGFSLQWTDLAAKRLELLRELVPHLRRLAIMANASASGAMLELAEVGRTARSLGLEPVNLEFRQADDIASTLTGINERADALFVCGDPLANTHRVQINTIALGAKTPTMYASREYVEAGGLVSYGASFSDLYRRAGEYVDKILRGTKAGDIPIQQPTKFDLIINLKTAKKLGLALAPALIARADDVIE